jgi:hypothetical protein
MITKTVHSPGRPATLWMRVAAMASGRVSASRMVVRRRASLDLPAPGGPRSRRLWSERLHSLRVRLDLGGELSTRGCWPSAVPVMPQPLGSTDHLVGLEDERWRDGQPQRFGRLQVDDAREGRKLFHRQVGRRGALFETVIAEGPGRRVNPGYRPKRITTFMAYRSWRVLSK